jgi:hypothetical protein
MGNYTQQKGSSSDKNDKKDAAQYVKFEIPLNIAEPNGDKYDRKVKIFNDGKSFKWCEIHETTDELFDAFGCKAETTNDANRRHHLYIALFSGRAKEIYIQNYNHFNSKNNELEEEDQANDTELQKMIIDETAKSFFNNWENAVREQQQYMRQNLFIGEMKPSTFIERLKRINKFLRYFPRERVFEMTNIELDEEQ